MLVFDDGEEVHLESYRKNSTTIFIIDRENITTVLVIDIGPELEEIEIFADIGFLSQPSEICFWPPKNPPPCSDILPPLKQLKSMEDTSEVFCKSKNNQIVFKKGIFGITCRDENHKLIFKKGAEKPACVRESTVQKLVERGWTSDYYPQNTDVMENKQRD